MPSEETRRLLKLFGIAVTDLEVAVAKGAATRMGSRARWRRWTSDFARSRS